MNDDDTTTRISMDIFASTDSAQVAAAMLSDEEQELLTPDEEVLGEFLMETFPTMEL